ncbi:MAG: nucleotidyltransferase domain-containing protein [Chloroflexota bacterium]|nr:nucleotidyltransferase domain-containing protein [Chloroflexota bacterium]MDE2931096.1 nucleotidyltransferase domain-containing protein [Chloroflexota bacterium]
MDINELLSIRWRERAELLRRIDQTMRSDHRVRAAWLTGSVARGEDDALSDLDVYIVVADKAIDDFADHRRIHAARPARPILLMDNLSNAPVGGAYLLALYEGEAGPQHVDWFWQAKSTAHRPDDAKILFDRAGLPVMPGAQWRGIFHRSSGPPLGPKPPLADVLTHKIAFFWAMTFIAAKYIARRDSETAARMTGVVSRTLTEAAALCHNGMGLSEGYAAMAAGFEAAPAIAQLRVLRELVKHAEDLDGPLATHGIVQPSEAISQICQFFDLAEALVVRDVRP